MEKLLYLTAFLVILAGLSTGLEAEIKDTCDTDERSVASIEDEKIAEPGHLDDEVCVETEDRFSVRERCAVQQVNVFSLENATGGDLTVVEKDKTGICSQETRAYITDSSCETGDAEAFSTETSLGGEVGNPGELGYNVCISEDFPDSYSVEIEGIDGTTTENDFYAVSEHEDQVKGLVDYGTSTDISSDSNSVSMTMTEGPLLIPNTGGSVNTIEEQRGSIESRDFVDELSPSFGFSERQTPEVRVVMQSQRNIEGFDAVLTRNANIVVRNKGLVDDDLTIEIIDN